MSIPLPAEYPRPSTAAVWSPVLHLPHPSLSPGKSPAETKLSCPVPQLLSPLRHCLPNLVQVQAISKHSPGFISALETGSRTVAVSKYVPCKPKRLCVLRSRVHLPPNLCNYPVTCEAPTLSAKGLWCICKEAVNVSPKPASAGPGD